MGKQAGPHYITGTVGDRTYYRLNGQYLVRAKSTLSRKRVKRSPAFRRTMEYAGLLGQASKLAVGVYRMIPRKKQRVDVYRKMTGVAMGMLKTGMDEEVVKVRLIQEYVPKVVVKLVVERPKKRVALFGAGQQMKRRRRGIWVDVNGRLVSPSQSGSPSQLPESCCGWVSSRRGQRGGRAPSPPVTDHLRGCQRE